ncbi:hypothetical protein [Saccharothrix sp.]|uniref:hypothetical protein n=1 Tax=Saccharothrix sp. TaxID=1873460 RepID=UPI002810DD95|nr:hypothetical protein [Saccharothrix sp.]
MAPVRRTTGVRSTAVAPALAAPLVGPGPVRAATEFPTPRFAVAAAPDGVAPDGVVANRVAPDRVAPHRVVADRVALVGPGTA